MAKGNQLPAFFGVYKGGRLTHTLLCDFVYDKGRRYAVPSREGTPRGEPIGFSLEKYLATLCALMTINVKQQARDLNISYGVLRKWRTEEEFMKMVNIHAGEFALIFLNRIKKRYDEENSLMENFLSMPLQDIANSEPPPLGDDEFTDITIYHPLIWNYILSFRTAILGDPNNGSAEVILKVSGCTSELYDLLCRYRQARGQLVDHRLELEALSKANLEEGNINFIVDILQRPKISIKDRKRCLYVLTILKRTISRRQDLSNSK